jgi:A49-like RNA polymerase I associated factor
MSKGEVPGITYIGKPLSCHSNYLLGIQTGKSIKIMDATLLEYSQYINSLQSHKDEANNANYFDQKIRLVEDFGTKKSKKIINSLKANMVSEDAIGATTQMKKLLSKKAHAINASETAIREETKIEEIIENKSMLPLFDDKTNNPKEIYSIYGSIVITSNPKRNF